MASQVSWRTLRNRIVCIFRTLVCILRLACYSVTVLERNEHKSSRNVRLPLPSTIRTKPKNSHTKEKDKQMHRTDIITKRIIVISMENKSQRYSVHEKEHMHVTSAECIRPQLMQYPIEMENVQLTKKKRYWNKINTHTKKTSAATTKKAAEIKVKKGHALI